MSQAALPPDVSDATEQHLTDLDAAAPGLVTALYLTGSVALDDYHPAARTGDGVGRIMPTAPMPHDYDADPGRFLASAKVPTEDVHPGVAARLASAGAHTVLDVGGGNGKLARLLPDLHIRCLLIDLSPAMLALAPRPVARADGSFLPVAEARPFVTLSGSAEAASFLRMHGMSEQAARRAAATLDLPMALTMRGCLVYATKARGRRRR
jgi:SAM-dependent methyltransferase